MLEKTKAEHGGYRPGAGRKPLAEKRRQYQIRALPVEIPIIKEFVKIVREDIDQARAILAKNTNNQGEKNENRIL